MRPRLHWLREPVYNTRARRRCSDVKMHTRGLQQTTFIVVLIRRLGDVSDLRLHQTRSQQTTVRNGPFPISGRKCVEQCAAINHIVADSRYTQIYILKIAYYLSHFCSQSFGYCKMTDVHKCNATVSPVMVLPSSLFPLHTMQELKA